MTPLVVILGFGTVGQLVAARLSAAGRAVLGVRRTPQSTPGVVCGDIADAQTWATLAERARGLAVAWPPRAVLLCANPGLRRGRDNGLAAAAGLVHSWAPEARLVYTGTTAVYADAAGAGVGEEAATLTDGPSIGLLAIEEEVLRQSDALVLRVPALVGPGRRHALERLRSGITSVAGNLDRPFSFLHEADLAELCVSALSGGYGRGILNAASPQRISLRTYYQGLASAAGVAMPHGDGQHLPSRWIDASRLWAVESQRPWRSYQLDAAAST